MAQVRSLLPLRPTTQSATPRKEDLCRQKCVFATKVQHRVDASAISAASVPTYPPGVGRGTTWLVVPLGPLSSRPRVLHQKPFSPLSDPKLRSTSPETPAPSPQRAVFQNVTQPPENPEKTRPQPRLMKISPPRKSHSYLPVVNRCVASGPLITLRYLSAPSSDSRRRAALPV